MTERSRYGCVFLAGLIGWMAFGLAAVEACSSSSIQPCGALPDANGCPLGRGGTCQDDTCSGLYDCREGVWRLSEDCQQEGAAGPGGSELSAGSGGGGGNCNGIEVDRTGQIAGCAPPLQEPECPALAAELCRPCATVCTDFFMCRQDGWEWIAYCNAEGDVVEP